MNSILQQLNHNLSALVAQVRPALVQVTHSNQGGGAGTIWQGSGMIITNAHVVGDGHNLTVTLHDRSQFAARLVAYDRQSDLAALMIDAHDLPIIKLGDAKAVQPGEWVMALGHPWGVVGAVTGGTVIGAGADLPEMPAYSREWLAVSLHMRPGHSGGSLVDGAGRLLGVNTMISGPEVGLAVPVHVVRQFLKRQIV